MFFQYVANNACRLDTNGGPVINARGRVLRHDGQSIDGLHGAGNRVAGLGNDLPVGQPLLYPSRIGTVERWIAEGAKNN